MKRDDGLKFPVKLYVKIEADMDVRPFVACADASEFNHGDIIAVYERAEFKRVIVKHELSEF